MFLHNLTFGLLAMQYTFIHFEDSGLQNIRKKQANYTFLFVFLTVWCYTDKKENQIFLIYKEIQSGAVAKSYMRKGFLIYEEMRKYFSI